MTQSKLLVSIITVTYNSAKTLEETIKSVINQSYSNIEYIIIDGGSTDGTLNIIKKYSDYISYWVSEPDKGIYDAMNKGINIAKGEIIGIINSDDWYEKDIINEIVQNYIKYGENKIYHGNIKFHYKNGTFEEKKPIINLKNFYKGTILFHPTFFVPKKIYNTIGVFNLSYKIAADYDFMLRNYINNITFIYINKCISNMRKEGESVQKATQGYKEVMNIAINAGFNKNKVIFYTIVKILIYKFYRLINKL